MCSMALSVRPVSPSGQRQVRITPELIRVADGTHVWGEPYEAVLADVFPLQADVAAQVAEVLRGTLGGAFSALSRERLPRTSRLTGCTCWAGRVEPGALLKA